MPRSVGQFELYFNKEEQKQLVEKFGTTDKKELTRLIKEESLRSENQNHLTIKEQLELEKLKEKQNRNSLFELTKREKEADVKIKEYHADKIDVIGTTPSNQAKNAMDYHVNGKPLPHSKENMYCPDCKWFISGNNSISYQINRLRDHVELTHKRRFTESEEQVLQELLK